LAGIFFARPPFSPAKNSMRKFTQISKTPGKTPPGIQGQNYPPMKSRHFTRFSKNAPFGKPGVLRGFLGLRCQVKPDTSPMENRDDLPDPLFMQKLQEFYIKQGGDGSKTEPILSPVSTFPGNGVHYGPGLGRLSTPKRGVTGG
jgi:hypothetical protein